MEKLKIFGYYDEWFHITQFENETTIIPEVKRIDLDTEYFTIKSVFELTSESLINRIKYPDTIIKDTDIIRFIKKLYKENKHGINNDIINQYPKPKYLHFYRVTKDEFIVVDYANNAVNYKSLINSVSEQYIF